MQQLRAAWKWLLSFRKASWELEDYPIRLRHQDSVPDHGPRLEPVAWSAQVVNWWQVGGIGATAEEALARLRENFARYRSSHDTMPRPGTGAPIEFASSDVVDRHAGLARDFMARILDVDSDDCFISDESSLWDFHGEETNDELHRRILLLYGVDVSDVEGAKLSAIFERIARRQ